MEPEAWEEHWDGFDADEQVCAEWFDWLIINNLKEITMKKKTDCEALADLLSLVMNPSPTYQEIFTKWDEEQMDLATKWATAEHLAASDNPIKRKPVPEFLEQWAEDHKNLRVPGGDKLEHEPDMTIVCKRDDISIMDGLSPGPGEVVHSLMPPFDIKKAMEDRGDNYPMPHVAAFDFDGVMHEYSGWTGEETIELPIDVAGMNKEFLTLREAGWKIIVWTSRADTNLVETFLNDYCIIYDAINSNPWAPDNLLNKSRKIPADVYIDDRAIVFAGTWAGMADKVMNFKPWWRREPAKPEAAPPRPFLNLSICGYTADQIALFTPNSNATMVHYQNLGYKNWVVDQVTAISRIPKAGGWRLDEEMDMKAFVVQLCFNYEIFPVEFELISVAEGETVQIPSYLGDIHCGLSHIGFHIDNGTLQEAIAAFLGEEFPLLSLVSTYEHTGCDRLYDYAFMDTRQLGFISKLIYRRK